MLWEYLVRDFKLGTDKEMEAIIDQRGAEGWELVSVVGLIATSESGGCEDNNYSNTYTSGYRLFFKQPSREITIERGRH